MGYFMSLNEINKLSDYFDALAATKPKSAGGTHSPLVNLFKAAQEQVFQATLECENLKATKKSLKHLIRSTQSVKDAYRHGSRNLAVRWGLIKPRGMKEALYNADAVI